jgi:uncharacterized protein YgbK (DUF1537 family)
MVIKLLIIADDFTGALDTGVQLSACGAVTRVVTKMWDGYEGLDSSIQVLVVDTETRHLSETEAYQVVYDIAQNALKHKIPYIYKKTDSALRGNIGSELKALKDAAGIKLLPFIPAFPQMGRITRHGIHFINEKPVRESVFGKDPFEPVECSYVPDIIHRQIETEVMVVEKGEEIASLQSNTDAIVVFDADNYEDIVNIGEELKKTGKMKAIAGCAGFAASLPNLLELNGNSEHMPKLEQGLLVVCGSVNPITCMQLDAAEKAGFTRVKLAPEEKLINGYWDSLKGIRHLNEIYEECQNNCLCIIDTNDEPGSCDTLDYAKENGLTLETVRKNISSSLGRLTKELIDKGMKKTLLITGGDTLIAFMDCMKIYEMEPVCEMSLGTVLSVCRIKGLDYQVISKSGGFGDKNLFVTLAEKLVKKEEAL